MRSGGFPRLWLAMTVLQHKVRFPHKLGLLSFAFVLASASCDKDQRPTIPVTAKGQSKVSVRAFTEAAPVRSLVVTNEYVFIATAAGLERWSIESGELLLLSSTHGLPGSEIFSMAYDKDRDWLWIATDGGVTSYELATSSFSELPRAPKVLRMGSLQGAVMAPALDGGVWIGTKTGLFYSQAGGKWLNTGVAATVTSLYQAKDGTLWIGTKQGLFSAHHSNEPVARSEEQGCDFKSVSSVRGHDEGSVLVIAESDLGESRIALLTKEGCATYQGKKEIHWNGSVRQGDSTYLLSNTELFRLGENYSLDVDTDKVVDVEKVKEVFDWQQIAKSEKGRFPAALHFETTKRTLPRRPVQLAANDEGIFVSTLNTGTLRWANDSADAQWYRQGQIVSAAQQLTVACPKKQSCIIALGTKKVWHWVGDQFIAVNSDRRVHAVVHRQDGSVVGLRDSDDLEERTGLVLSKLKGNRWVDIPGVFVETPGVSPYGSSFREAPDGVLWLALGYKDGDGADVAFGVAAIDLTLNVTWYHRASFDENVSKQGVLPVPVDVTGIGFVGNDVLWLASSQGATRVTGVKVHNFNERDGLRSELLRALVCTSGGMVYVASSQGVGAWDGERWRFPSVLKTSVRDLALGLDGRLWLATKKGLGVYDGERAMRVDAKKGLLENDLIDIESDDFGRIWVRSEHGLVLVSP